jgi:hypothetical protein
MVDATDAMVDAVDAIESTLRQWLLGNADAPSMTKSSRSGIRGQVRKPAVDR